MPGILNDIPEESQVKHRKSTDGNQQSGRHSHVKNVNGMHCCVQFNQIKIESV